MPVIYGAIFNPGRIVGFLEIDQYRRPATYLNLIDLDAKSIAIMGRNGTGKTEILKKMADTVLSELKFQKNGDLDKYWTGGFIFSPEGLKDDQQEIFTDTSAVRNGKFISDIDKSELVINNKITQDFLNSDATAEEKLETLRTQSYYIRRYEYVFPPQLKFTKSIIRKGTDWNLKFNSDVSREILKQNQFLLMMHPVPDWESENYQTFDAKYQPAPLICRIVSPNEDTPKVSKLRDEIFKCYESFSHGKAYHFDDIVEKFLLGMELAFPALDGNVLFTPFIMHRDLLTDNWQSDEWPAFFAEARSNFPQILIEWPQDRFQFESEAIINVAVDIHLRDPEQHKDDTDFELLDKATSVTGLNSLKEIYKHRNAKETYNTAKEWAELLQHASDLLEFWDVTPKWLSKFEGLEEVKPHGVQFDFDNGNLTLEFSATINETTRRWIYRALQCAMMAKSTSPYKLVIWDEPELGLHPTAVQNVVQRVLPWLKEQGFQLLVSTHSAWIGGEVEKLYLCEREIVYPNRPVLKELPNISSDVLHEIGLTKLDLLTNIKNFLIVEGEHDRVVFETLFAKELVDSKTKIITFGGTENLLTIPESEVLFEYFNTNFVFMLDGKKRSQIETPNRDFIKDLNEAFAKDDSVKCLKVVAEVRQLLIQRKVFDGAEIFKLLDLIEKWAHLSKQKVTKLSKISFVMLNEGDIIHYLNPRTVFGSADPLNWKELRQNYHARQNKSITEKEFYKRQYGARISISSVRAGAKELLDQAIPADFLNVIEKLIKP